MMGRLLGFLLFAGSCGMLWYLAPGAKASPFKATWRPNRKLFGRFNLCHAGYWPFISGRWSARPSRQYYTAIAMQSWIQ
jgi:hypothetical protein